MLIGVSLCLMINGCLWLLCVRVVGFVNLITFCCFLLFFGVLCDLVLFSVICGCFGVLGACGLERSLPRLGAERGE